MVNAADVVISKPGYGIASECLLHQTPAVFIDRPDFRETPPLMEELSKCGRCAKISLSDFFEGSWKQAIEGALANESPWQISSPDGAALVAERLACYLHL
jgi:UDP-N-acetylglucosamine:LPS N-acetylglucosamine transferase